MTQTATRYETVIGIEVHAQLLTRSKMFCACSTPTLESAPNTHVCPVCLGAPGMLPVINKAAVELTIMTGLALNCEIATEAKFDRKNYHYPDLMKGYQISEYDMPICVNGWLDIEVEGLAKRVGITRVHLEEDTARLQHATDTATAEPYSLIDVNRAGMPLMEIVSEPDIRSAEEARAYLQKLRQVLRYIGASRANMEEGNMRCEPNVSIREPGAEFGQKVELKNINSFKHAYDAIKFEERRQAEVLETGGRVLQETRGWREDTGQAVPQRTKEFAEDYRYFPDPDLPPLVISREWVDEIRQRMPELPDARKERFVTEYGLSVYDAGVLTETRARADFYEEAVEISGPERAKSVANWVTGDLARLLNADNREIGETKVTPQALAELIALQEAGTISGKTAKDVFEQAYATGKTPKALVEEQGLTQLTSSGEVDASIDKVIAENEKAVADYRGGKEEAIKFLVGQVMRETRGRASPDMATQLLKEKLDAKP
ncbi:MAG TPA: Asp-tRNA(Asn)/Glu-tRNA(Gln) amidotransferase subunit GatB [Dehalococcoidia bacterium]|nr:Asp-tRNA(Asn)/Glu-tRNA(Gln) amidotransferase subunit GatB [Dehalococcoidia bacterium]